AETYLRVDEIHSLVRQFVFGVQNHQKAIRIIKVLSSAASVEQRIAEAALARAWDTMGNTEREADRPDRAASAFEQALSIQRTFLSISATPQDRSDFARTLYNRGLLRMDQNQTSPAAADFEQSISFSLQALQEDPGNGAFQQGLARCRLNLGVLMRNLGNSSAALKQYDAAIAILQNLVQALPSMNEYVVELAQAWLNRGNLLLTTRKDSVTLAEKPLEAAQASFSEAVNLLSALKAQYPNVPQYDIELANALNGLGGVQQESGDSEAARESWTRARVAFLDVLRVSGDSAELYTRLGLTMANLALLIPREHPEQRIPLLQEACSHQRSALRKKPDATLSKSYLRSHLLSLSRALIQQGNHAEAATAAEEFGALELQPTDWQTAAELLVRAMAACLEDDSLTPESQLANAESYASRAVTALRHISERDPLAIQQIAQNEKFQAIRERADFRMLLEKAAENSTKP
ncbi:MAG: tetratricopeptide repeat protein, partial [Planctomycetota bacterium]